MMRKLCIILAAALALGFLCTSCGDLVIEQDYPRSDERKCLLYYAAGYNDLAIYIRPDIEDLIKSDGVPSGRSDADILLLFSHLTSRYNDYSTPTLGILERVYRPRRGGKVVRDTLMTFSSPTAALDKDVLTTVINYAFDNYECDSYGLILSSHSTGYLPVGYYSSPSSFDGVYSAKKAQRATIPFFTPEGPAVKSIFQQTLIHDGLKESYELSIQDFASAIERHFDYILMDACLMAGVEVAYELRDKTDYIGFSPTEILAEGLPYKTLLNQLFAYGKPNPEGVCHEYMDFYKASTTYKCATYSFIKTSTLEDLASVCREIYSKYREPLSKISSAQGYYRNNRHYFYDLADIMAQLPLTEEESLSFKQALSDVVVYEDATDYFLEIDIKTHCGLSTYLPSRGSRYLDSYYRTLAWNKATQMVEE